MSFSPIQESDFAATIRALGLRAEQAEIQRNHYQDETRRLAAVLSEVRGDMTVALHAHGLNITYEQVRRWRDRLTDGLEDR